MNKGENEAKVWAIMHVTHEDMGSFEHILRTLGIKPVGMMAQTTDIAALDASEPDLVIIMGGPMGAYETDTYSHLKHEIAFAERRIKAGKPILGVCLGSQIMARALGARVYKGPKGKEIGWNPVDINEAGLRTPLRHLDRTETYVTHWHGDTFDLPKGATLLASSAKYAHQAYAYGDAALGLQFHPEVTEIKLERWYAKSREELDEVGTTVDALRADSQKFGAVLKQQNRAFFTEWLEQVAPHMLANKRLLPETQELLVDAAL